jgi:glycerol-3-phosphate acyltransferase PlsY
MKNMGSTMSQRVFQVKVADVTFLIDALEVA